VLHFSEDGNRGVGKNYEDYADHPFPGEAGPFAAGAFLIFHQTTGRMKTLKH